MSEGGPAIKEIVNKAILVHQEKLGRSLNPVEIYNIQEEIGIRELSKHPFSYLMLWFSGTFMAINGCNLPETYRALNLRTNRLHIFGEGEVNFIKKIIKFFLNQDPIVLFELF